MRTLGIIVLFGALLACGGGGDGDSRPVPAEPAEPKATPEPPADEWYSGGTLHKAGALEWQEATYENKLATCADFIAKLAEGTSLKPEIAAKASTLEGMKPLAKQLVEQLDDAMEKKSDPDLNSKMFTNQKVPDMVAMTITLMGWTR